MAINTVESSFTQYADTYDRFSGVQQETAARLVSMTAGSPAENILEIGCGTGNYTALLRASYPAARIAAFDISAAMIARARAKMPAAGVRFAVMDAEETPAAGAFDMVTSNACFHWFRDMDAAVARYASIINPGGTLTASVFGTRTFHELADSLRLCGKNIPARTRAFPSRERIASIMAACFTKWEISETVYSRSFDSVLDLLRAIKYSGVKGDAALPGFLFTPDLLRKAENHYRREYGEIKAAFQVFFIKGYR